MNNGFKSVLPFKELVAALNEANIKLESIEIGLYEHYHLDVFSTAPCFSQLKSFRLPGFRIKSPPNGDDRSKSKEEVFKRFVQSPNLSNLTCFQIPFMYEYEWTNGEDLKSLLTSPTMSNDLTSLRFPYNCCSIVTDDLIEAILTAHVIPGDETSPLKYSKLQKLEFERAKIGPRSIELIVKYLPRLTHLNLERCKNINDAAITALIATEHEDLHYPYPVLSNLIYLNLESCPITDQGCIALSKSQLLDQLEWLNSKQFAGPPSYTNLGLEALLIKTKSFSNLKRLEFKTNQEPFRNLLMRRDKDCVKRDEFQHFDNCCVW